MQFYSIYENQQRNHHEISIELYEQRQKQIDLEEPRIIDRDETNLFLLVNLPNGKNRMMHNIANHRQSDGRRGACGSNFCRRFTNVAELFELGTTPG